MAGVARNGQQPATELAQLGIPPLWALPYLQEDILRNFFGQFSFAQDVEDQAIDPIAILLIEQQQRMLISLHDAL